MGKFGDFLKKMGDEAERYFKGALSDYVRGQFEDSVAEQGGKINQSPQQAVRGFGDMFDAVVDPMQHGAIAGFRLKGGFWAWVTEPFSDRIINPAGVYAPNAVTLAALNDVLSVYLVAGTPKTTWYLAPINNSPTPTLAAADTSASHAGWVEVTDYVAANRVTWVPDAVSGQAVSNTSTTANFVINTATIAVYGAFLISNNTKGGSTGILFATGAFGSVQNLVTGQTLKATYTCPATAT